MSNYIRNIVKLSFCLGASLLGACSDSMKTKPQRLSSVVESAPDQITQDFPVSRNLMRTALKQEFLTQRLRLVPVFTGPMGPESVPHYRLFGIEPESIYAQLGLQNADILVAANDRTLPNPEVFKQYVKLLPQESEAQVQVVREGKTLVFRYKMQD